MELKETKGDLNHEKKMFLVGIIAILFINSFVVYAGYSARGFGPMNNYYATLSVSLSDVVATTRASGADIYTSVHATLSDGSTVSSAGESVASVGRQGSSNIFLSGRSVHRCGDYVEALYTNV